MVEEADKRLALDNQPQQEKNEADAVTKENQPMLSEDMEKFAKKEGNTAPEGSLAAKPGIWQRGIKFLPVVLITLLYLLLQIYMFGNSNRAWDASAVLSLRYESLLSSKQVEAAKHQLGNPESKADFSAAFWFSSQSQSILSDRGTQETPTLFVDGDMASVYAVDFLYGNYPSAFEKKGLALSEALAWDLLGGVNVVGAEVEWMDSVYTVRGVFRGNEKMMLAQIEAGDGVIPNFEGVELTGELVGEAKAAAESFYKESGLPKADSVVNMKVMPDLISLIAWMPALLFTVWFLFRCLGFVRHMVFWKRQLIWFGVLLLLAFMLPRALGLLPSWLIPNRWSDFQYWGKFAKEMQAMITARLSLTPSLRDVQLKKQLISQVLLFIPALVCVLSMIRRWGDHMRRQENRMTLAVNTRGETTDAPAGVLTDETDNQASEQDA